MRFDQTAIVRRLKQVQGDKEVYANHIEGLPINIQPLDGRPVDLTGDGDRGKYHLAFTPDSDIIEKDLIEVGGRKFEVVGVERYQFLGKSHLEIEIVEQL